MSFSINASGTKEDTIKALDSSQANGDTSHFAICRDAMKEVVTQAPDGCVFNMSAYGHHDFEHTNPYGTISLNITIKTPENASVKENEG